MPRAQPLLDPIGRNASCIEQSCKLFRRGAGKTPARLRARQREVLHQLLGSLEVDVMIFDIAPRARRAAVQTSCAGNSRLRSDRRAAPAERRINERSRRIGRTDSKAGCRRRHHARRVPANSPRTLPLQWKRCDSPFTCPRRAMDATRSTRQWCRRACPGGGRRGWRDWSRASLPRASFSPREQAGGGGRRSRRRWRYPGFRSARRQR